MRTDALSQLIERASGKRRLLFLDYDGTLVPFAATPDLAHPDPELLQILELLCARADTAVHIVTGRSRVSIDRWLGHLPVGLHAEHGHWTRAPLATEWAARSSGAREWLAEARILMNAAVVAVPGSMVEEKESGIAWHYRLAEAGVAADGHALLESLVPSLCARYELQVLPGDKVLELRARGVHKGHVVRELSAKEADAFIVAIGDDVTDDDMFEALPPGAFAIAAATRPQGAHFRIEGHRAVRAFLRRLCEPPTSCTRLRGALGESDGEASW